ncbi:hypothetical protein [Acinetobacter pittii]|uniref:hypothetical protein n=1 Tax=Acinetobacter pittii TaxID=48296 RepID=UPI0012314271|nr:hypothetical protein [Acinetobacter pittii]
MKIIEITLITGISVLCCSFANAEYCEDQFYTDIGKNNAEIENLMLQNKSDEQESSTNIQLRKQYEKRMTVLLNDETGDTQANMQEMRDIQKIKNELDSQKALNDKEAYDRNIQIANLSTNVPIELKQKAQECAKKIAPINSLVNYTVMGIAAYFNPTATMALLENNPKALYVDMGEIINGNIMGGPNSLPNTVKKGGNQVLEDLGLPFRF